MPLIKKYKSQAWVQMNPEPVTPAGDSLIESSRLFNDTTVTPSKLKPPKPLGMEPEPKTRTKDTIKPGRSRPKTPISPHKRRAKKNSKLAKEARLKGGVDATRKRNDSINYTDNKEDQQPKDWQRSQDRSTRRRYRQGRESYRQDERLASRSRSGTNARN